LPRALHGRLGICLIAALLAFTVALQPQGTPFTLYVNDSKHALPVRTIGGVEFVSLDQLASVFKLRVAEDTLVGGLTVQSSGQTILLIPGQSFASIGPGKIIALPAAIQRDRNTWQVPLDFVRLALGPALNERVEIRRPSRTILFGDVRLPQIVARVERTPPNARVTLELQSPAPHRVTRDGNRLVVRFEAVAVDLAPVQGAAPEFAAGVHAEGSAVVIDLGPSAANFRAEDADPSHVTIDLLAPGAPPAPPAAPIARGAGPDPRVLERSPGGLDTLVLDPGHGGEDAGVRGPGGTQEKDYVLQFARRLKAAIETRIGLRVILTRDADETVPLDRRAAIANNDKADLFLSLHLNASVHPDTRGAHVLALNGMEYQSRTGTSEVSEPPVPLVGGGTRTIDLVPWDLAQLPFVDRSSAAARALVRELQDREIPLLATEPGYLPLRPLVSANMPALMLEIGFLSNRDEETALNRADRSGATIEAVLATIETLRRGIPPPLPAAGVRP
jgi:N-acetylmuramoyl-L-alanine amidase